MDRCKAAWARPGGTGRAPEGWRGWGCRAPLGHQALALCISISVALVPLLAGQDAAWAQTSQAPPTRAGDSAASRLWAPPASQAAGPLSVLDATIPELQEAMARGELTSVDLVEIYLARIEAYDRDGARLNAIVRINPRAREEAAALDQERARGAVRGPLHGIPVIVKDNYDTRDLPTTGGSVALAGMVPPDDAFQVTRLREAGAIVLAKSNMHELAMGITTVSSLGGQTRNPYDPARNPGGSSGGTGAAIAGAFGAVGWGTDTCGSIRIPSCFNNLFGLRPTKGLSSIDGIIPLAHTQDVGGPLARNVTDLAVALDATVGPDSADPATLALEGREIPRFRDALDPEALQGVRLGVVAELFGDPPEDREVDSLLRDAIGRMVEAGADTVTVEIPGLEELARASGVINYEAKFDLMDYFAATPGAPVASLEEIMDQGLHHEALEDAFRRRERVEVRDSEEYRTALAKRDALAAALLTAMEENGVDALAYPNVRRRPALIGESQGGSNCQVSAGSGFPAMAVPGGFTEDGLPTGLEVLGRPFDDARLVAMAYAYEQAVHPRRRPPAAPALEDGRLPAPVPFEITVPVVPGEEGSLYGRFAFDPVVRTLAFDVEVSGIPEEEVYAVTLHRVGQESSGPAIHRLMGPGQSREAGVVALGNSGAEELVAGGLSLALYTASHPRGLWTAFRLPPRDDPR
ncbi:MAG: amidase family protein [Gemmatimonadota bacterium]